MEAYLSSVYEEQKKKADSDSSDSDRPSNDSRKSGDQFVGSIENVQLPDDKSFEDKGVIR